METIKFIIEYGVIGFLILMSIIAISIAIERFLVYRKLRLSDFKDRKSLEHELTKKLHKEAPIGKLNGGFLKTFYCYSYQSKRNTNLSF